MPTQPNPTEQNILLLAPPPPPPAPAPLKLTITSRVRILTSGSMVQLPPSLTKNQLGKLGKKNKNSKYDKRNISKITPLNAIKFTGLPHPERKLPIISTINNVAPKPTHQNWTNSPINNSNSFNFNQNQNVYSVPSQMAYSHYHNYVLPLSNNFVIQPSPLTIPQPSIIYLPNNLMPTQPYNIYDPQFAGPGVSHFPANN